MNRMNSLRVYIKHKTPKVLFVSAITMEEDKGVQ